jgi:thiazole/oxazole-forming peptide maturase SagC family component
MLREEDCLKIPDRFTIIPAGPGEFRLHSLTFSLALKGGGCNKLLSHLLEQLDGRKTVGDLVRKLSSFGEDSVKGTLEYLLKVGALERANTVIDTSFTTVELGRYRPQISFLSHFVASDQTTNAGSSQTLPMSGLDYQKRIQQTHVTVFGVGRIGSQLIRSLVVAGVGKITAVDNEQVGEADIYSDAWFTADQEGGNRAEAVQHLAISSNPAVQVEAVPEPADRETLEAILARSDFAVLCHDHFNPVQYEMFNQAALIVKKSWTSARLSGFEFQIGPTIIPFQTSCYLCFDLRYKSNLQDFTEYQMVEDFLKMNRLQNEALAFTPGVGLLALEVLKAITWFMAPATCSHLYTMNLLTLESKLHPVLKIPRCSSCGRPSQSRPTIHAWQTSKRNLTP